MTQINIVDAKQATDALVYSSLIDELAKGFAAGCVCPERHHHTIENVSEADSTLLLMPAWDYAQVGRRYLGIKLVTVCPGNNTRNLPGLTSTYILCDADTGQQLAFIDGNTITARRTVATSALGARFLSRENSRKLLLIGSGKVASLVPDAYRAVRPIKEVAVWDINPVSAEQLVKSLNASGFSAHLVDDLEREATNADIISAATLATDPIIHGEWLSKGTHVDLIGGFTPAMREADDTVMIRAAVYIDTPEALKEAGDLVEPIQKGVIAKQNILGTLRELCRHECEGRTSDDQITVFKAVGSSLADLVAARMIYEKLGE
ncbi:ornithine cyclodeaminase family protein [Pseudochrobactrum sp. MP213Fo]|uniref:ornithine cyclodeaminase family protein n=1 Tax=Pseudochrobactrum sp. MP213Fo TaxID=3022250 RepID=UPI003BA227C6